MGFKLFCSQHVNSPSPRLSFLLRETGWEHCPPRVLSKSERDLPRRLGWQGLTRQSVSCWARATRLGLRFHRFPGQMFPSLVFSRAGEG